MFPIISWNFINPLVSYVFFDNGFDFFSQDNQEPLKLLITTTIQVCNLMQVLILTKEKKKKSERRSISKKDCKKITMWKKKSRYMRAMCVGRDGNKRHVSG